VAPVLFPEMKACGARPGDLVALLAAAGVQTQTTPVDHHRLGRGVHDPRRRPGIGLFAPRGSEWVIMPPAWISISSNK
jgi:hypothetical protein